MENIISADSKESIKSIILENIKRIPVHHLKEEWCFSHDVCSFRELKSYSMGKLSSGEDMRLGCSVYPGNKYVVEFVIRKKHPGKTNGKLLMFLALKVTSLELSEYAVSFFKKTTGENKSIVLT